MHVKLLKLLFRMSKSAIYASIFLYSLTVAFGSVSEAQRRLLSQVDIQVKDNNYALVKLFHEIEKSSEFDFIYSSRELKGKTVSLDTRDWMLGDLLNEISRQSIVSFRRINETITVKEVNANLTPQVYEEMEDLIDVSGKITDDDGEGLPGATIIEKGSSNGTVTDVDGNYTINVDENATLQVSFVGYEPVEVQVNGRSTINVELSLSVSNLEEVVVIGYGTQKKKDVTGAISSIKGDVISEVPVASMEQTLSGRMAGVQVINGSGAPGSGATIRVRGVGTLNNNEPLYVIDGVILGNVRGGGLNDVSPLSLINPNDIESIDVLKDASATAIYGARAGNGVVIITTKRGTRDRLSINYETYLGTSVLDESKYNRLSGPEWAQITARTNELQGNTVYTGQPLVEAVLAGQSFPEHDWVAELTRPGTIQSHNLSVNGGSESSNYYSSVSYFDQLGTVYGSSLTRYTLRFNSDHNIGKRFKMGNTLLLSRSVSNRQGNINPSDNSNDYIKRAVGINPYKPIYAADGSYAGLSSHPTEAEGILDQANQHIIWAAKENQDIYKVNRAWASVYLDFKIMEGLTFHTMGSIDFTYSKREDRNTFNEIDGTQLVQPEQTRLLFRNDEDRTLFWENTLTYDKAFGDHKITALVGLQFQNTLDTWFSAQDGAFEDTEY
ncbi:MAG: SusC/RagA family TonB-linked outer membrane protein [Cyclobacteriaceae bacterium]|nr:SusC/RagA family TonB-linked outer membrane protein [Cyclobacteriaceae bacterium SS2]